MLVFVQCLKDKIPIYSKHKMTGMKKPEDLTLDEVREQMALYQRLYYKLRMTPIMQPRQERGKG